MVLDKADDEKNRRHPPPLSPSGGGQGEDVEDFLRSPTLPLGVSIRGQYKDIYCARIRMVIAYGNKKSRRGNKGYKRRENG